MYRATLALAFAYWAGGCAALPDDDVTAAALARLPVGAWRSVKAETLAALAAIMPLLRADYEKREQTREVRAASARQMTAKRIARRGRSAPTSWLPEPPRTLAPFRAGTGRNPHAERADANDTGKRTEGRWSG